MATHDDGFHEIQLNGKQLVFLFMTGTVIAVVIFLLGVFVGRGVRAEGVETDPLVTESTAPPAPEIPAVAATNPGEAPASSAEELSYPNRLSNQPPPREELAAKPEPAREAPPAPAPKPAPEAPARAAADVPAEPAGDGFAIQVAALGKRGDAENIVRRLADKGYAAYLLAPQPGAPSVYRVRVGKFQERSEAEAVSARLQKEEQFKPWIVR